MYFLFQKTNYIMVCTYEISRYFKEQSPEFAIVRLLIELKPCVTFIISSVIRVKSSCRNCIDFLNLYKLRNSISLYSISGTLNHQSALLSSQFFSAVNRRHPSNPFALDTSTSTIGPYRYSFFINSPFLWSNIPAKILQITDVTLIFVSPSSAIFFNPVLLCVYCVMYCFALCLLYYV